MSLTHQLPNLNATQIRHLADTMLNASIALETGGDYCEIIRRAKQRKVGLLRRVYDLLQTASRDELDIMSKALAEVAL